MPLRQHRRGSGLAYRLPASIVTSITNAATAYSISSTAVACPFSTSTATLSFAALTVSAATLSLAAAASEASTRLRFGMERRSDDVLSDVESERCSALLWRWRRVCVSANGQQGRSTVPQTCRGLLPRL